MSPLSSWILGWILSVMAAIGNGSVIYLITTRRRLHTTANYFILSLAVADFGVGITLVPSKFTCDFWPAGYCIVLKPLRWFFIYASVANLCAMASERYISIVNPLRYNTLMRRSRVAVALSVAWVAPALIRLISFSVVNSLDKNAAWSYFLPVILFLFEFFPCGLLLIVVTRMVLIARKIARQTAVLESQLRFNHTTVNARLHANVSTAVSMIGFVIAIFLVCYAASLFSSFCDIYRQYCTTPVFARVIRRLCLVANSAANPIAYAMLKRDIRREMKKTLLRNNSQSHGNDPSAGLAPT